MANERLDKFTKAFGENAYLQRSHTPGAPFQVVTPDFNVGWNDLEGGAIANLMRRARSGGGGVWSYDPKTQSFTDGKSHVLASDLGITEDPAYNIAEYASSIGRNRDPWSDYAYHDPTISHEGLHENLRNEIGDIESYENKPSKSLWNTVRDLGQSTAAVVGNYFLPGSSFVTDKLVSKGAQEYLNSPLGKVANIASGVSGGLSGNAANYGNLLGGTTGTTSGAGAGLGGVGTGEASNLINAGVGNFGNAADAYAAQIAGDAGSLMPELGAGGAGVETGLGGSGYFGGIGGGGAGGYSLPGIGAASGSSAIPEIGIGGAAGSSATPALFSTSELASTFPGAYGASNLGSGLSNLTSTGKTASTVSDVIKAIGGNAAPIGALLGALTGKAPQTVSGSSSRPAWMNQGLPTITAPRYTSRKIQGDPLRYGMGPQQKLYTNEQSEVYTPQNFGTSGGLPYGVPIARQLAEEPMAYAGGSNTFDESGGRTRVVDKAHGGKISGKLGGLAQSCGYVQGGSSGQADNVPARLSPGEYVMDADIVSALGDGNNDAGAKALDKFRENIRKHKRSASVKSIPPKAKSIEQYLKGVK